MQDDFKFQQKIECGLSSLFASFLFLWVEAAAQTQPRKQRKEILPFFT
jgi:hypothetical protein